MTLLRTVLPLRAHSHYALKVRSPTTALRGLLLICATPYQVKRAHAHLPTPSTVISYTSQQVLLLRCAPHSLGALTHCTSLPFTLDYFYKSLRDILLRSHTIPAQFNCELLTTRMRAPTRRRTTWRNPAEPFAMIQNTLNTSQRLEYNSMLVSARSARSARS